MYTRSHTKTQAQTPLLSCYGRGRRGGGGSSRTCEFSGPCLGDGSAHEEGGDFLWWRHFNSCSLQIVESFRST